VKLSAKLLTGLAFVALIGIAVVGLSNNSASAAVDGKVYVTNVASNLTTEGTGKPTGRTTATTVYGTYPSWVTTGTSARDIVTNSNKFIVTVLDADLNTTTTVTNDSPTGDTANVGFNLHQPSHSTDVLQVTGSGFGDSGDTVQLTLTTSLANPIVGTVSDIKVYLTGTDT
jgi:hypothetical protein